jgi:LytS/YehU family sensor histidine kinase
MSSALHYVFLAVEASEAARRQALESAVLAREAELRALRAQVNPHFLYNSLHSIAALAPARPTDAQQMAVGLGEFLRQSLRLGSLSVVTLDQEVNLARQYLAIEQVRYAERLTVQIDVAPEVATCELPPLLLQPLVENAITHGVAGLIEPGTVRIVARRSEYECEVRIGNDFDPEEPRRPGTGMGLANVRARLRTHFGTRARMDLNEAAPWFEVSLRWPLTVTPVPPSRPPSLEMPA